MEYIDFYKTPKIFSNLVMISDGEYLTSLCFESSRDLSKYKKECKQKNLPIFEETKKWLDMYFSGIEPDFLPKYKLNNLTEFRMEVINIITTIKFGKLITYKEIAERIARRRKVEKISSQAVGGAVGWNPICIIIPCHRVVGSNGNLTGYSGGIQNKAKLLELEGVNTSNFFIHKR